ncbi:MAG: hypothetical protein HZB56_19485 [Deltaproteobacteria bacterium]|nr:hypothetical protein [Deltaproteobacteria bacterium]
MAPSAAPRRLPATLVVAAFDRLEAAFSSTTHRRAVAAGLVGAFLLALLGIELARRGWLGGQLAAALPRSHFHAIDLAFYLLLAYEVVGLVFGIAQSVSNAAGKQFEIFSLILLRGSFESFGGLDEPLRWAQARTPALHLISDAAAALLIFVGLGFYYAAQRHRPHSGDTGDRESFVAAKKAIALALLLVFAVLAARSLEGLLLRHEPAPFFGAFYTTLVFADLLVVLISVRYSGEYRVVFRNSGLAVATVLLRLALSAPSPWSGLLGLAAVVFALGLTLAYNRFSGPAPGKPG